jgi:diguanylate cyclase (GGDEF)-like protein
MGGDEFTIILESVQNLQEIVSIAKRIIVSIANPYSLGENEVSLTASVGIAVFPTDGMTGDLLLKRADDAMYRAKEKGKNNYHFYSDPL